MKKAFAIMSEISCRPIDLRDWEAYRGFWKSLEDPNNFNGLMEERDIDDPATYHALFKAIGDENVMFGLWDGDKMIGQTGVFFESGAEKALAVFQGSEILDEYRGLGLSKELYEARIRYLQKIGYNGKIVTSIRPDKEASLRAALGSGFKATGESVHDKMILEREGVDLN